MVNTLSKRERGERAEPLAPALGHTYKGMLPVAYDVFQVSGRVEKEVFPPLIPVYRHSAIYVNTAGQNMSCPFSFH